MEVSDEHPAADATVASSTNSLREVYTILDKKQKRFIIAMASLGAFFSPLSGNIYYPALNSMATSVQVSGTLAPLFIAGFADSAGRRPAYLICFIIYTAANIGLALQNNYAALLILRCVQSSGSSATGALANAVIADVSTSAERGSYIGYTFAGAFIGQSLGPVLGGVLSAFLGWRSIFWLLTIFAAVFLTLYVILVPETCRSIVGNGSIPPPALNRSVFQVYQQSKVTNSRESDVLGPHTSKQPIRFPNPLATLKICLEKEAGILLLYAGIISAGLATITTGLPSQFHDIYHFNDLQIGLSCIPMGVGSCLSAITVGRLADWNYKQHATRLGVSVDKRRQQDLSDFPIEVARLEIALPLVGLASATLIAYGWVLQTAQQLAAPLILLFFVGFAGSGAFSIVSTLVVDVCPESAGQATAANNLVRCFLGAGASAVVGPMLKRLGRGGTYTIVGGLWVAFVPLMLGIMKWGKAWREEKRKRGELRMKGKRAEKSSQIEMGMSKPNGVHKIDGEGTE
ncbi:hypothetical protein JMJ35_006360 [Cladonia borealis]|uniref:Major facilitator superfamily (MFS) profile domain-containing protein n=1 Tax=Cladonia borealis TaxID=184061 RepID=A0AA39V083_9LECA|nr:hypothetical protein JMJ35_006360 [Cladonia borealis]